MKVVVFGTGEYYKNRKDRLSAITVTGFLDNNIMREGKEFEGRMVYSPAQIHGLEWDYILLMSKEKESMKMQLLNYGVVERQIIEDLDRLYYIYSPNGRVDAFVDQVKVEKEFDCLLFSNGLSLTGAPIVLYELAKILKKRGQKLMVVTFESGPLLDWYLQEDIEVCVIKNLLNSKTSVKSLVEKTTYMILNTVLFETLVSEYLGKIKLIWWIHEAEEYYPEMQLRIPAKEKNDWFRICAVSQEAEDVFAMKRGWKADKLLPYGISELRCAKNDFFDAQQGKKFIFTIVGTICKRKGHDVFLGAIEELTERYNEKIEFHIVGSASDVELFECFQEFSLAHHNLRLLGEIVGEALIEEYGQMTALVCTSRNDPLPVVLAEAMCMKKPIIVSSAVGTCRYLTDGINALFFQSEKQEELVQKLEWIMDHSEQAIEIGKAARTVYEKEFSLQVFEKRLEFILKELEIDLD